MEGDKKHLEDKNPKRKMKTPSQLEILERVYAEDRYPSELVRADLSTQLNLTDRQLQMWFCHRRLKDRKVEAPESGLKKQKTFKGAAATAGSAEGIGDGVATTSVNSHECAAPERKPKKSTTKKRSAGAGAGASAAGVGPAAAGVGLAAAGVGFVGGAAAGGAGAGASDSGAEQQKMHSSDLAIMLVEEQLGESLREDGPALGYEFDPLPPGAFDTPIEPSSLRNGMYAIEQAPSRPSSTDFAAGSKRKLGIPVVGPSRVVREHQFIPEHPTGTQYYDKGTYSKSESLAGSLASSGGDMPGSENGGYESKVPNIGYNFFPSGESPEKEKSATVTDKLNLVHDQPRSDGKKRKSDEAKLAREHEAHEKRLKKEAEKQEAARRKKEDQERKEQDKANRDKQKEQEKRMREEERKEREAKKEQERQKKLLQKEQERNEKLRNKEELRRQKEASKLKAQYERATAKKLAKLSTGLMDDEQLELMQMGAFVQGLVSGDMEGGAGFDTSKVELKKFPPIRMKKPLTVSPWIDNDQNVAKLFMIWRFLTTFSDAIGLWPFTVEEFVQGLHDFDSRILSEIHVALLKTLIKDVEDAAQAAASGTAGSAHSIAVAAGGHPQIVEAAYTWGFDIQEWGQHLGLMTWPEVLRQFALAAGYGPKWKKRGMLVDSGKDLMEMNDGHCAIATLRSGAAAANAVAIMRGKNTSKVRLRKSQHRLTPGTVKYAAFHVLSLEGSKGLTIVELTDRIQKSGLRDLSSSKTPEASISAALSRDTHLFERVAPSTYCVRAHFRKDPEDADEVMHTAMEDIYQFDDIEAADKDEDEEVDEEFEGDEHEIDDPEQENFENQGSSGKVILRLKEGKVVQVSGTQEKDKEKSEQATDTVQQVQIKVSEASTSKTVMEEDLKPNRSPEKEVKPVTPEKRPRETTEEEMEIDESQVGEAWVQGLIEGEYADLSVEERLNALSALVDVLNEGNTVRSVLEERYESASALKRQLWEEVQLDKRRLKEDMLKSGGPSVKADEDNDKEDIASTSGQANHSDKSRAQMKAEIRLRAEKLYVIRAMPLGLDRRYNRYWQFASDGGQDPGRARIYVEGNEDTGWDVIDTEEGLDGLLASLDTRGMREAGLNTVLRNIEGPLRKAMKELARTRESSKAESSPTSDISGQCSDTMDSSGAITVELGKSSTEIQHALDRYSEMDRWLWNQCLRKCDNNLKALTVGKKRDAECLLSCSACHELYFPREKHCQHCHTTIDTANEAKCAQHLRECDENVKQKDTKSLPSRFQLLKHLVLAVEICIPEEALKPTWNAAYREQWLSRVKDSTSCDDLSLAFTDLEAAVDGDWTSSSYETAEQALSSIAGGGQHKSLPWVPQTTAAVALRVMTFDAAIAYSTEQKQQLQAQDVQVNAFPVVANPITPEPVAHQEYEAVSSPDDSDSPPEFRHQNGHVNVRGGRGRAQQGNGGRGGRSLKQLKVQFEEERGVVVGGDKQISRGGWSGAGGSRGPPRGRQRLLFRGPQKPLPAETVVQQQQQHQHHQTDNHQDNSESENEGGDGSRWPAQDSDESEHSDDEYHQQQQQSHQHQRHQQQQLQEQQDNEEEEGHNIMHAGGGGVESDEEVVYEEEGYEEDGGEVEGEGEGEGVGGGSEEEVEEEEVEEDDDVVSDSSG